MAAEPFVDRSVEIMVMEIVFWYLMIEIELNSFKSHLKNNLKFLLLFDFMGRLTFSEKLV